MLQRLWHCVIQGVRIDEFCCLFFMFLLFNKSKIPDSSCYLDHPVGAMTSALDFRVDRRSDVLEELVGYMEMKL